MPNQMIALQARNPQLPDPARATTQMANMMNMARQAEAAQLQGERLRQEMEYARAGEGRAEETQRLNVREKDQAFRVAGMTELRNRGVGVLQSGSEDAYQLWLRQADAIDPDSAAVMRLIAPTFNKDAMTFAITKADEFIANNTSKRKTEIIYDKNNIPILVESGGNTDYEATPIVATKIRDVNQPPRATPTAPPVTAGTGVDMRATQGSNTTPQDLIGQGMNPNNIPSGMPTSRPISFNQSDMGGANAGQMTPEVMSSIVDSAFQTGVMAQVDFDQLLATQPPQNKQALVDSFRRANITLQADAPSLADSAMGQQQMAANPVQRPQSQFADLRGPAPQSQTAGLRGAPPMEQTLAQYRVGDPIQGRTASPLPGSSQVPLGRVAGEAAAQEGGKQGVRVKVEPAIAGATKTAELRAQKDAAFSDAQSQFDAAYTTVKNRLSDIKRFKEHPAATRIIGPIDAFTLNTGRARGAQEIYRTMVAAATFDALQEMRTNSPTGGALGNVSDADIRILKESIGALGQAQDEKDFFESLDIYEDRLNQVLGRLEKRFRESYGYRLGSGWKPAEVATKRRTPTTGGRKAGAFTITEVDE
jgi:hypothetical protein